MDMKNKKVLVFGSGISGIGAGKLLEQVGASVVLYDGKETLDKEVLKAQLGDDTKAEIILGELSEEVMETLDLVVMSPGRRCACNHRNQWKDDDDCTFGRDYEEL